MVAVTPVVVHAYRESVLGCLWHRGTTAEKKKNGWTVKDEMKIMA